MLDAKVVGKVIKKFRKEQGLSQDVLSGLADITRSHLSAIERGERRPTLDTFYKIGNALRVGPAVLMNAIMIEMRPIEEHRYDDIR